MELPSFSAESSTFDSFVESTEQSNKSMLSASILGGFIPLNHLNDEARTSLLSDIEVLTYFAGQQVVFRTTREKTSLFLVSGELILVPLAGKDIVIHADESISSFNLDIREYKEIKAKTDCCVFVITQDRLDRVISWNQITEYLLCELSTNRDYDEDIDWIQTILKSNLFLKVPPVNIEFILDKLTPMVVDENEVIVRQGEIGECCYFIKEGSAEVIACEESTHSGVNSDCKKVADITVGRCFGEDALVYQQARNATVKMRTDGVLMRLEKCDFLTLLKEPKVNRIKFDELGEISSNTLIDVRTEEEFDMGHLPGAINIPLSLLSLKARLLEKTGELYFYCNSGRRAVAAAFLLQERGFSASVIDASVSMQSALVNEPH